MAALVLVAVLAAGSVAQAATPFTAVTETGAGEAEVAVDASGNAHLAWLSKQPAGASKRLQYCVIRPRASACESVRTLWPAGTASLSFQNLHVFVMQSGKVVVTAIISGPGAPPSGSRTYAFQSTDGGATFGAATAIAPTSAGLSAWHTAAPGPGDSLSLATTQAGDPTYANAPLSGGSTGAAVLQRSFVGALLSGGGSQVAALDGSPVIARNDTGGQLELRVGTGNLNDPAGWFPPSSVTPGGTQAVVAGGPGGLVLAYLVGRSGSQQFAARKLSTIGLGSGVAISERGSPARPDLHATQSTGNFHFAYESSRGINWSFSPGGANARWYGPFLIVRKADKPEFDAPEIASGPSGNGLVVWDGNGAIKAARLEFVPEAATGERGGRGASDPCVPPRCVPLRGGSTPAKGVTVGGQVVLPPQVTVESCAQRVKVKVNVKRRSVKRKRGSRTVTRVRKVVFRLLKQRQTRRKPPYRISFGTGVPKGTSLTVKATISMTVKKGRGRARKKTKTVKKRFVACPFG